MYLKIICLFDYNSRKIFYINSSFVQLKWRWNERLWALRGHQRCLVCASPIVKFTSPIMSASWPLSDASNRFRLAVPRLAKVRCSPEQFWTPGSFYLPRMHPFTKVRRHFTIGLLGLLLQNLSHFSLLDTFLFVSNPSTFQFSQVQQAMLEEEKWTTPSMTYFRYFITLDFFPFL